MRVHTIRKVCVIGAGTMGGGIAAHLANLGFDVTLLDVSQHAVIEGFERIRTARPPLLYMPDRANSIRLGNTQDNFEWVSEADWVCEAIFENLEEKRRLFARIEEYLDADAMVTTNTSGIQIALLAAGRSPAFLKKFLGAHFFNPPRHLRLLELIPTRDTDPSVTARMRAFFEHEVARRVVEAKDTPGFIANRFGVWTLFHAIHTAEKLHLSVEEVDAITGVFLGRPKSGTFRLGDIVGLDILRDIATNLREVCVDDPYTSSLALPPSMEALISRGWLGAKAGRGYYRREGRDLLALDLTTMAYRDAREVRMPSLTQLRTLPLGERVATALELRDEAGEFLRNHLVPVLEYANYLKEKVSHSMVGFDRAMQWGFGWELGPFGLADAVGLSKQPNYGPGTHRSFGGTYIPLPYEPDFRSVTDYPLLDRAHTYNLRDLGEGVTAVCLTTKMGVINPDVIHDLTALIGKHDLDRFVLTSEARSFSVGFDLNQFIDAIRQGASEQIETWLVALQNLGDLLEHRTCVAAIHGHCLGGGFEIATSCPVVVSLAECQIGLPEAKVGLLPAGRGSSLMRLRSQESSRRLAEVALMLSEGTIATNADQARSLGYLRPGDITCYNPDLLMTVAREAVRGANPAPREEWKVAVGPLPGLIDRALEDAQAKGRISAYDALIGEHIKNVFARTNSFEDGLTRERLGFLDLCKKAFTSARIKHMLENGKPLRN